MDVDLSPHDVGLRHICVHTRWGVSGGTTAASSFTFAPPPMITHLDQAVAPTGGGTQPTIGGFYFDRLVSVRLGSAAATRAVATSATEMHVTTPAHPEGLIHAVVTTTIGSSDRTTADRFRYARTQPARWSAPTEVDPDRGDPQGLSCPSTTFCALVDRTGVLT